MKTIMWAGIIWLLAMPAAPAQTNDLAGLLQQGLLEEQGNQNLDAAIADYQSLAAKFDQDRKVAATAVFRIGECYRMQGRTNEAAAQYERVLRDFSDQKVLATLSQENLKGLGVVLAQRMVSLINQNPSKLSPEGEAMTQEINRLNSQMHRLSEDLNGADRDRILAEAQQDFSNPVLDSLMQRLTELQQQLAALTNDYSMSNVMVVRVTSALNTVNQQIDAQLSAVLAGLNEKILTDEANLKVLRETGGPATGFRLAATTSVVNDEEKEIQRLQDMVQNSPDMINEPIAGGNTELANAAAAGRLKLAAYLLAHGAEVNYRAPGNPPLIAATAAGNRTMVEFLLAHGADVNIRTANGGTALHIAAEKNFPAVMEALLSNKAEVNAQDGNGDTPFCLAVLKGQEKIIQMLLAAGANPKQANHDGKTPLYYAARNGSPEGVKMLLAAGADPNVADTTGRTPLYAAILGNSPASVKLLLAAKADPGGVSMNAPLFAAVCKYDTNSAEALLAAGADPNRASANPNLASMVNWDAEMISMNWWNHKGGVTPFWLAIDLKQLPMVQLMLKYKANPDDAQIDGRSLLFKALDQPDILAAMLDAGADMEVVSPDERELTPLGMAATLNLSPAVEILLKHGAKPNVRNRNGVTPLHAAVYGLADNKVFELLLAHGANPNVRTGNGRTPLDELKSRAQNDSNHLQVQARALVLADLLRRHGALDRLPDWNRITVSRPADNFAAPVFYQGKNNWNHFTLLETLLNAYIEVPGFTSLPDRYIYLGRRLPFPDLTHITIVRPARDLTNETRIVVNLLNETNGINFSKDIPLDFGDVVEIPERDHALNEPAEGLTLSQFNDICGHFGGKAQLVVKEQRTDLPLYPQPAGSYLKNVLDESAAKNVLLASSDLSQVKVTRRDPKTGKKLEWTLDCTPPHASDNSTLVLNPTSLSNRGTLTIPNSGGGDVAADSDLWLRDGDVIEVPEKQ